MTTATAAGIIMCLAGALAAQPLPVTFKYAPSPNDNFVRVFVPGEFNNWGPNNGGVISPTAPSRMTLDTETRLWLYNPAGGLKVDSTYQYKLSFHLDQSGSNNLWVSDPANPVTNPDDQNNSVLTITDPMIFQMDHTVDAQGNVTEVSSGIFGSQEFVEIMFSVNGDTSDGLEHYNPENGIFQYTLPAPTAANALFELVAINISGDTVRGKIGSLPVGVEDSPRPPGIEDGINYHPGDPTTVTLSLFAPHKQSIHVIGDFNDWEVLPEYLMKRDSLNADSVHYWIKLDDLTAGVEYAFQYFIDGQIRVGDPFSHKILDPVYDPDIGDTYPNLKPYPNGKTDNVVSVFQTGQEPYSWKVEHFDRPPIAELIIYELLVRDFVADHDWATLVDSLDYLQRLGINTIELMPVAEFGGNVNWGYEPNFHLALDKYYGPADDLKRFIDACHERGIAVLIDVVYNHAAFEAPFSRIFSSSATGAPGAAPSSNSPWLNTVATHPFNVFNDVNHESTATKYWLDRANAYWLTEFKVDGFRFDLSKGFTQIKTGDNVGLWGAYDETRINLLTRMADRIWEVDSTAIITLEHFANDREERELAAHGMDRGFPGMLLWNNVNHAYNEATMGYNEGLKSNLNGAYYGIGGRRWPIPHLISFMESHDEQWLMYKNRRFGACAASPTGSDVCNEANAGYNTRDIPVALDRMKMAGAFFLTLPGPHMIWQFGELGYGFGPDGRDCLRPSNTEFGICPPGTPSRTGEKPIRWEYNEDPLRQKLYKTWSELLRFRREHEVLRSTDTEVDIKTVGAIKRITMRHPEMTVLIMGNFGVTDSSGVFWNAEPGTYYNFFKGGEAMEITDPAESVPLAPGEFFLLTSIPVEPAEEGLITVAMESVGLPPASGSFHLASYPNPFSTSTTVEMLVPNQGRVRLELFDVLGRLVMTVIDDTLSPGRHELALRAEELPAGMYFLRLTTRWGQKTMPLARTASV